MDFIFDKSLVLYLPLYKFDGAFFMSKDAYGHLCTVTGALWRPDGRYFDGMDDLIDCPNHSCFDIAHTLTVEAWMKTADLTNEGVIADRDKPASPREWYFWHNQQKLAIDFGDPALGDWEGSTITDEDVITSIDVWYHTAFTFDRGTVIIYVNGNIVSSSDTTVPSSLYTGADIPTRIGNHGVPNQPFDGLIDIVMIYNRALTPQEVLRDYLATKWRYR